MQGIGKRGRECLLFSNWTSIYHIVRALISLILTLGDLGSNITLPDGSSSLNDILLSSAMAGLTGTGIWNLCCKKNTSYSSKEKTSMSRLVARRTKTRHISYHNNLSLSGSGSLTGTLNATTENKDILNMPNPFEITPNDGSKDSGSRYSANKKDKLDNPFIGDAMV